MPKGLHNVSFPALGRFTECESRVNACELAGDRSGTEAINPDSTTSSNYRNARRFRERNPEKALAHLIVRHAIICGKLKRPSFCSACIEPCEKPHAHHDDYEQPLQVRWLCRRCHLRLHNQRRADKYRFLSTLEAMRLLAERGRVFKSLKTFNAAVHRHGIPHRYVGGRLVFEQVRLDAWVRNFRPAKRGPKPKSEAA